MAHERYLAGNQAQPQATLGALGLLREVGFTILVCIVIAAAIWGLGSADFLTALWYSLGIGLSTHLFTSIGMSRLPGVHIGLIWLVTIPAGVGTGIVIGSLINGIPIGEFFNGGAPLGSLIIALTATYVFYSYYSMNEMRARIREQELSQLRAEKRLMETRMRLLQSQIEPHFLFNTLSHVVSLVRSDATRAEEMLQKLTHFLRASLRRSRAEQASLQDELDLVDSYLSILKVRMGERLDYSIESCESADRIALAPLMLQPLVENAVVHGLEPTEAGGSIIVTATTDDETLVLTVADTGVGLDLDSSGSGFGLSNVRSRLQMRYGQRAQIDFSDVEPHGLRVRVSIPREPVE